MRTFVAVELSARARDAVAAIQRQWKTSIPSARWVRPENLHLTLRFLGDVDAETAGALAETLRRVAHQAAPFTYCLRGGGCFPSSKRARVLWVGVEPVPDALRRLHAAVEGAVRGLGFEPERRGFQPHLTIARLKSPDRGVGDVVAALAGVEYGDTEVSELVLFESRLSPRGAAYHALERFPLGGTQREQLV